MKNPARLISVILVFALVLSTVLSSAITVSAETIGYVDATNMAIRTKPSTAADSQVITRVSNVYVTINSSQVIGEYTWYNITYNNITGYMRGDYMKIIDTSQTDLTFEEELKNFPESYHDALKKLHALYPNWKFTADNINLTFSQAVDLEVGRKQENYSDLSWRHMGQGSYDWTTKKWVVDNGGWYFASREVVEYYMDPRNFLDANYVYTFLHQAYSPALQNEEGVRNIIKGTFLERGYTDENDKAYGGDYAKVIMAAAEKSGVSPYVLAATIIQEQGTNGTSALISGTYPGYVGYYNFFNIGASGANSTLVIENGLKTAKSNGWSTRSASIIGGASTTLKEYFKRGQDTYYLMNYNVKNPSAIWQQYAQAVHNAVSSGKLVAKTYSSLSNATLNFKIPVFKEMPTKRVIPTRNDKLNNYYFDSITIEGLTPSFHRYTYYYDLKVSQDSIIKVAVPISASFAGEEKYSLKKGDNIVKLGVISETGYTYYYTISVLAEKDCSLYVDWGQGVTLPDDSNPPANPNPSEPTNPTVLNGDASGDGKINGRDLANVQMHILGVELLTGDNQIGADTNKDGKINGRDLANIQMHILGIELLT